MRPGRHSYHEVSARERIEGILDPGSFLDLMPPTRRLSSPHLELFDAPVSFDDGVVIGEGLLDGRPVAAFAQEGRFMGGAIGEVHGAKITGLLKRAAKRRPSAVLAMIDSGGVRLQEANAGEIAVSEIIRAIFDLRASGIPVIALVGGVCGAFGGGGIICCCCDRIVVSEKARIGISGPEVIETTMGVEAFDSRDRSLVWRTVGGRNRFLLGIADAIVSDNMEEFRKATIIAAAAPAGSGKEHAWKTLDALQRRMDIFGDCKDGIDLWREMGIDKPESVPDMRLEKLVAAKARCKCP